MYNVSLNVRKKILYTLYTLKILNSENNGVSRAEKLYQITFDTIFTPCELMRYKHYTSNY